MQPWRCFAAWRYGAGLATLLAIAAPAAAAGQPQRVVSLDLCTDQLLLELAPRQHIAAVTHLAGDASVSAIPEAARGIAVTHGSAEDVLRYDPDLILAGPFGVAATIDLLRRLERHVLVVPLAQDLDGVRRSVQVVAAALAEEARGAAMLADFERRLAAVTTTPDAAAPSAVVYQVGGIVSGPGSLADAVLTAAGFRNLAGDYRLARNGRVPLELLLVQPPDLLLLASRSGEYPTPAADNLRHPALMRFSRQHASLELPWQLWLCGTPHVAEAIERLAAWKRRFSGLEPRP